MTEVVVVQKRNYSADARRRMSEAHIGKTPWNKGKTGIYSQETLRKIGAAHKGKIVSEETRRKMSKTHRGKKRTPFSEEHMRRISESKSGENHPMFGKKFSSERRAKISKALRGKKHTEEHRQKNSEAQYGKTVSEETRAKISNAMIGENHPNWKGGISFEPYCTKFNDKIKETIRNRDDRVCVLCGKSEILNGQRLSVHHISGNKMMGCNGIPWYLCALCHSCNSKPDTVEKEFLIISNSKPRRN